VSCGDNASCGGGECECDEGYDDPNEDGNCTAACPDGDLNAAIDVAARSSLLDVPQKPWEEGEWYSCSGGAVSVNDGGSTKGLYRWLDHPANTRLNTSRGNVCDLAIVGESTAVAYGHSHPYFVWDTDRKVLCEGTVLNKPSDVTDENRRNKKFSTKDRRGAWSVEKPLYLVVPARDLVKVYRKIGGRWKVEIL